MQTSTQPSIAPTIVNRDTVLAQMRAAIERRAARDELGLVSDRMDYMVHQDGSITRR